MVVPVLLAGMAFGAASERYGVALPGLSMVKGLMVQNKQQIDAQAFRLATQYLVAEEGRRNIVYKDTRGFLTVGIGHKVLSSDNLKLGDSISIAKIDKLFAADIAKAFEAAKAQATDIDRYTPEMIARLTSVNFQLGTGWRFKFPNTWAYLKQGNIQAAINNLIQSSWYKQTPQRVALFINTLKTQFA